MWASLQTGAYRFTVFLLRLTLWVFAVACLLFALIGVIAVFGDMPMPSSALHQMQELLNSKATAGNAYAIWQEITNVLQWSALLVLGLGILLGASRAETILKTARYFFEGRGAVMQLHDAVRKLDDAIPRVQEAIEKVPEFVNKVGGLEGVLQTLTEQLDSAQSRIMTLQRDVALEGGEYEEGAALQNEESENQQDVMRRRIKEIRNESILRLEGVIEGISDHRRKRKYLRMSRRVYPAIVESLRGDGLITPTIADNVLKILRTYNNYRRRSKIIPDKTVADFDVWIKLLEAEFNLLNGESEGVQAIVPPIKQAELDARPESA